MRALILVSITSLESLAKYCDSSGNMKAYFAVKECIDILEAILNP